MKLDINKNTTRLLYLFLATDVIFILLHILYLPTDFASNPYLSIEKDQGYAELFQYIKEYWIALILSFLAWKNRSYLYLSWSILFCYLLLDDAISIHERIGSKISYRLAFSPAFNLRAVDFGELIVSACVGLFFLICIATAYRFSDRLSKKNSRYLIIFLLALALFGIVVDMLHIALQSPYWEPSLALIEDAGEMIVMSFIAWFVFNISEGSSRTISLTEERQQTEDNHSVAIISK
ncbi:hypothetical protein H6F98_10135 [Microcoleus sp. FACHB-SPT15]|uniref:hypothetical protein n=1 Tax=Microcoleus sp. FACHB-SPT15 TaxID=2692830 RepID=UPI00178530C2|nr:hypothetical protein [Microcoleus sp. FACHB-SPT15]MBD1805808.1 hypothetical protein [Microcoleus sp. FACHB-SPT15]